MDSTDSDSAIDAPLDLSASSSLTNFETILPGSVALQQLTPPSSVQSGSSQEVIPDTPPLTVRTSYGQFKVYESCGLSPERAAEVQRHQGLDPDSPEFNPVFPASECPEFRSIIPEAEVIDVKPVLPASETDDVKPVLTWVMDAGTDTPDFKPEFKPVITDVWRLVCMYFTPLFATPLQCYPLLHFKTIYVSCQIYWTELITIAMHNMQLLKILHAQICSNGKH